MGLDTSKINTKRIFSACAAVLALGTAAQAGPEHAVVRLPSHGCSGVVIQTGPGCTWILTCAHAFTGADRTKAIAVDVPVPLAAAKAKVGVQLVGVDYRLDLALVRLNAGPLPYVAPVAPPGHAAGQCLSVGYDTMAFPPKYRPTLIVRSDGTTTWTRERPWHGRSGGALLSGPYVVGVVSGYSGPSVRVEIVQGHHGIYVSHAAILGFLARCQAQAPAPVGRAPIVIERRGPIPAQPRYDRRYVQPRPCPT